MSMIRFCGISIGWLHAVPNTYIKNFTSKSNLMFGTFSSICPWLSFSPTNLSSQLILLRKLFLLDILVRSDKDAAWKRQQAFRKTRSCWRLWRMCPININVDRCLGANSKCLRHSRSALHVRKWLAVLRKQYELSERTNDAFLKIGPLRLNRHDVCFVVSPHHFKMRSSLALWSLGKDNKNG